MTDPVPSKERDITDELLEAVTVLDEPFHREAVAGTLGRASGVINRLRDDLEELHDAHDSLERENDRLRTALRGIQSCSTCERCRGAATLALGHACDPYDIATTCDQCERDAEQPAPEPEPTHFAFLIKRPRDKEAWPTIFASREGAEGYEHRASPVVPVCLTQPPEVNASLKGREYAAT